MNFCLVIKGLLYQNSCSTEIEYENVMNSLDGVIATYRHHAEHLETKGIEFNTYEKTKLHMLWEFLLYKKISLVQCIIINNNTKFDKGICHHHAACNHAAVEAISVCTRFSMASRAVCRMWIRMAGRREWGPKNLAWRAS